jgi:hypothetical protein
MFDFNAKLGHWPYRPVRGLEALLQGMDVCGMEQAAVSSLSAVHFLNPQDGNDDLARRIAGHRDRLVPFAVLRPNFAGWADDLALCLQDYNMRGVVLYPNYHEFELDDPALGPLAAEAARQGFPVCVQVGLEDLRRQFRPYKTEEVSPRHIGEFARAHPEVNIVALGLKFGQPELAGDPLPENLYFDTSNYEAMEEIEFAVARFGSARIVLGSNFPLFNPRANIDKLLCADVAASDRNNIVKLNAQRLLRMPAP